MSRSRQAKFWYLVRTSKSNSGRTPGFCVSLTFRLSQIVHNHCWAVEVSQVSGEVVSQILVPSQGLSGRNQRTQYEEHVRVQAVILDFV